MNLLEHNYKERKTEGNQVSKALGDCLQLVYMYHEANAEHVTRGFKLGEQTTGEILKHATEELFELHEEDTLDKAVDIKPSNETKKELADHLSCILHYMIVTEITPDELYKLMKEKFLLRYKFGD